MDNSEKSMALGKIHAGQHVSLYAIVSPKCIFYILWVEQMCKVHVLPP